MKVSITVEGDKVYGTKVLNEAGEELENVRAVRFEHVAGDVPKAWIEILLPQFTTNMLDVVCTDGAGRPIRRIEYMDGDVVTFDAT